MMLHRALSSPWSKKLLTAAIVVIGIFFLAGAVSAYGIYHYEWDSSFTRRFATLFRLPAAEVGVHPVLYTDYLAHLNAEKTFLVSPAARAQNFPQTLTPQIKAEVLNRAVRIAAVDDLAEKAAITVTPLDVERAYEGLIARAGTSTTPEDVHAFLHDVFGWDEAAFKRYVVRPAILEDALKYKRLQETKDATTFDREMEARLKAPDVKKYLKF